ncbi:MAG TPA: protein kinase [Vineibacter sp.]|nr:protein kinase [Vineibacter sp.]
MMTTADYPIALPPRHALHEYRIERVLGHGGFGITYLATDSSLRKKVAVKEYLPAQFAVRAEGATVMPRTRRVADDYRWGLDRFLEEARTLARFRHVNIVPVLRFFEANGTAYIVMEYEEGRSLSSLLAGPGRLPATRIRALLEGLMDGLARVHAAGFLHRDIKPSNIIVRSDGTPVLIDFGAARQALLRGGATLTSIVTPRYAPLEQYQADAEQGPWTDIYALAAVARHAITGEAPPEAPGRVRKDPCQPLADADLPVYSEAFLDAIDHGLAVHPEDRPQTIAAWRQSMGTPPAEAAVLDDLGEATPAAARTRLMQAPLTLAAVPSPGGGASPPLVPLRLGGADESQRVRLASPPRRAGAGGAKRWVALAVVLLAAGSYYGWRMLPGSVEPKVADARQPPNAPPPPVSVQPPVSKPGGVPSSDGRVVPKGDPVPVRPPPDPQPPTGQLGSIDELLSKSGQTPAGTQAPAGNKAGRDKALDVARQAATQAKTMAELAEKAHRRALERAGDARIRAAEAAKADLPGAERLTFDDGSSYAGQRVDGRRDGLGVAELRNGERQSGDWKGDRLEGLGVLRAGDGRSYEGEWRHGLPEGVGVFRLSREERYLGEVKGGQPQGAGIRTVGDGRDTTTRAGTWQNGALEGPGVETTSSGWRYEGGFRAGKRHGPGILVSPDGVRFHGTFVDGVADGYGVSVAPDGHMSSGEWRAGNLARADD